MSIRETLLELPGVGKVRRVHALEHATITLMSTRDPNLRIIGRSTPSGFWLYGDVETDEVRACAEEALRRLRAGQAELAVHPRCGTNLAVAGLLTGFSSFLASASLGRRESPLNKLPRVVMAATAAMIVAQPLGLLVQEKITTCPDASRLSLGPIKRTERGNLVIHFVTVNG
ncbi:MAG: DUF6391 domain-containing protein [Ardenticatenaceae bacterium]|nr:DUF6391 domain-containing protein [Ardenticatenaceae bacterium]HBY92537.1 hypothetical protein [Chloroflexota bacterium]